MAEGQGAITPSRQLLPRSFLEVAVDDTLQYLCILTHLSNLSPRCCLMYIEMGARCQPCPSCSVPLARILGSLTHRLPSLRATLRCHRGLEAGGTSPC